MALSAPITVFGVNAITLVNRADFVTNAKTFKVIGELQIPFEADLEPLYGGSNRFMWEAEAKTFKTDLTINLKQYDESLYYWLMGGAVTTGSVEASGAVTILTNQQGTSVKVATTGVASVALHAGSTTDLKAGFYVVKAASATTVNVYAMTDVDFSAGTSITGSFSDDMKINASPLTITTGGAMTLIPNLGVDLVGGSATIGMTTGDTAYFEVRPANVANTQTIIGNLATTLNKCAMYFSAMKKSSGEIFYGFATKVQPAGFSMPFKEVAWSTHSDKLAMMYDSNFDACCQLRRITRVVG